MLTGPFRNGKRKSCGCSSLQISPYREAVIRLFNYGNMSRADIARHLKITKNTVIGILYRANLKRRRMLLFQDDPRAILPDHGRIGLPPATETGHAATPLIEAVEGRWRPSRRASSSG